MKKLLFLFLMLSFAAFSCNSKSGGSVDQSNPESVVNAIFEAAKTSDYGILNGLCDPEGDRDVTMICEMKKGHEKEQRFIEAFKTGKIDGKARIEGDKAEVDILFGPDNSEDETIKLIKKEGKWYLKSM